MFKKISLTLFLILLSIHSTFAASDAVALEEPRAVLTYGKPDTKENLSVTFSIPATAAHPAFRLHSVTPADLPNLAKLHGDPAFGGDLEVVKYYADCEIHTLADMQNRYAKFWEPRLAQGLPWVTYPIVTDSPTTLRDGTPIAPGTFVGMAGLACSSHEGYVLGFGLELKLFWRNGWGKDVTAAVLEFLLPSLVEAGFQLPWKGAVVPVKGVKASVHPEHPLLEHKEGGAVHHKILSDYCDAPPAFGPENIGGSKPEPRFTYTISIEDLFARRATRRGGGVSAAAGEATA